MNRTRQNLLKLLLFCLAAITLPSHSAAAETHTWQFQLAPYAWLAGLDGTVATLPGLPPADIDVDFWDDILGNINGAMMLVGEARKDKFGVFMDVAYVNIESDNATPGPYFSSVVSTSESWIVTATGLYRLVEKSRASLDLIAGIRYWSVDSTLELRPGLLPVRKVSNKEDWVDPVVGLKGLTSFGESKFYVSGNLAIGGFGAGSDFMWDLNVNLGYQWTETFSTTIGYRYLDVDYEDGGFLYDVAQDGPVLGLSWRF
ncbi:MAG: hypothetical protein OEM01_02235 [Desulfobulbaceae bacterium]|nr:hypothetical protein [Desulfobulbaceae bacterium]